MQHLVVLSQILFPILTSGFPASGSAPTRFGGCTAQAFATSVSCNVSNVTTGMRILYFVANDATTGTFTVTDNCGTSGASDTYTTLDGPTANGSTGQTQQGSASVGANTTTCTVSLSTSAGTSDEIIVYVANSGTVQNHSSFNTQVAPGSGTNAITSPSVTTSTLCLCVGFTIDLNGQTATLVAGTSTVSWTLQDNNTFPFGAEDFRQSSAGSITATFTDSAGGAADPNTSIICVH